MNEIRQCLHGMGGKEILQIDFAGEEDQVQKEIEPERLRTELQQMQPGETLIVRFEHEEY